MSAQSQQISEFLHSLGLHADFRETDPGVEQAKVTRHGVPITVIVFAEPPAVRLQVGFAYLNPTAAAPLMRRVLSLNAEFGGGCYFGLLEPEEILVFGGTRPTEGLDQAEFTSLLDEVAHGYLSFCTELIRDFELQTKSR